MIRNEKEYRSAKNALAGFDEALRNYDILKAIESGIDPIIARAQKVSYERQSLELQNQIGDYESLKEGRVESISVSGIRDLGKTLIESRLAAGLTQRELANLAGLMEQQVQKYEKEFYCSASLARIYQIADAMGIKFEGKAFVSRNVSQVPDLPGGLKLVDFPFAEMNSRGWFATRVDRRAASAERTAALRDFFTRAPRDIGHALHRKTAGAYSAPRRAGLLAWQARILLKARQKVTLAKPFITPPAEFVSGLARYSSDPLGIQKVADLLLDYGVILVFERHLPKTKLDGAALALDGDYAVIGMTVRHDRVDNFWFVLLHELGHIIRHWPRVVGEGIIDEDAGSDTDELFEREADEFAENAILPKTTWLASAVRFTKSADVIVKFAARHELHPALIAGRIRRERDYTEFHDLLGNGQVRDTLISLGYME